MYYKRFWDRFFKATIGLIIMTFISPFLPGTERKACTFAPSTICDEISANASENSGSLIWPISDSAILNLVSSPFGPRWRTSQNTYDFHTGIDIVAEINTPVYAVADGVVYDVVFSTNGTGLRVVIEHPILGYYSAYLHLASASVSKGQLVSQGLEIGKVGSSGTSKFPHLHFEIRLDRYSYLTSTRNPMGYLPRPDFGAPTIEIIKLESTPIYSPRVSISITTFRQEVDLNQIRVILKDLATGSVLDDQMVDFNTRLHTGSDTLDQDGIQLVPSLFGESTLKYELAANFYNLNGQDSFTLIARAIDINGNTGTATVTSYDTTPPGKVTSLKAGRQDNNSITLMWLAPGDSDQVGTAAGYEIRYANVPVTSAIWNSGSKRLPDPPVPLQGGLWQTWNLSSTFSDPVYFALQATDPEGNQSLVSNTAQAIGYIPVFLPLVRR